MENKLLERNYDGKESGEGKKKSWRHSIVERMYRIGDFHDYSLRV